MFAWCTRDAKFMYRDQRRDPMHRANQRRAAMRSNCDPHPFFALPSPSIESFYLNVGTDFATNGERHVLERLRKADFRLAVDGGAHLGDWSFQLLERWPHCHIHAFEVAPETVKRLSAKADERPDRGRLTIHGIGLS